MKATEANGCQERMKRDTRYRSISQPSLEALRKLAVALSVSADALLFDHVRGPEERLRLQYEAVSRLDPREQEVVLEVLDGLLLKHDARRWTARKRQAKESS